VLFEKAGIFTASFRARRKITPMVSQEGSIANMDSSYLIEVDYARKEMDLVRDNYLPESGPKTEI